MPSSTSEIIFSIKISSIHYCVPDYLILLKALRHGYSVELTLSQHLSNQNEVVSGLWFLLIRRVPKSIIFGMLSGTNWGSLIVRILEIYVLRSLGL